MNWLWWLAGGAGAYWILRRRAIDLATAQNPVRGSQQQVIPYGATRAELETFQERGAALGRIVFGWRVEAKLQQDVTWQHIGNTSFLATEYFGPSAVESAWNLLPI